MIITKSNNFYEEKMASIFNTLDEIGYKIDEHTKILDFGCGNGSLVDYLRKSGLQSFGCDIYEDEAQNPEYIRLIKHLDKSDNRISEKYTIPFDDNSFDIIVTYQVFEHIMDFDLVLAELRRVLKPGGFCLHIFPGRYCPIERHIFVPFGSLIHSYYWYLLWAFLGVKQSGQKGKSAKEIARSNYEYIEKCTNYPREGTLNKTFKKYFDTIEDYEKYFLKNYPSNTAKKLYAILRLFPGNFIFSIYRKMRQRYVILK